MNKLLLSAAVSAAMFGGAANAALPPVTSFTIGGDTTEVFVSGASASATLVRSLFEDGTVCSAETTIVSNPTSTFDEIAFLCTVKPGQLGNWTAIAPVAEHKNILFHKRNSGGSIQGVVPVGNAQAISFLNIANSPACVANIGAATSGVDVTCAAAATATQLPGVGISDVDPTQFRGNNLASPTFANENALETAIAAFNAAGNDIKPAFSQIFGVAVTTKLYKALQAAQFPANKTCSPTGASYNLTANGFTTKTKFGNGDNQACMPSLTSAQIASILTGKIDNWNQLFSGTKLSTAEGTATGGLHNYGAVALGALTTVPASLKPTNTDVHICSRTRGSGTLATMGIKRLNYTCAVKPSTGPGIPTAGVSVTQFLSTAPLESVPVANTAGTLTGPSVHQMSSAGNVNNCMTYLETGGVQGGTAPSADGSTLTGSADFRWGIAYQSTDNNANLAAGYQFIKIDGVAPTQQNVVTGAYHDWAETTVQSLLNNANDTAVFNFLTTLPAATIGTANNTGAGCPATNVGTFGMSTTPATAETGSANHCWGQAGIMGAATLVANANGRAGRVIPFDYYATQPINPLSYIIAGVNGDVPNNCRVPVLYNGSGSLGLQLK